MVFVGPGMVDPTGIEPAILAVKTIEVTITSTGPSIMPGQNKTPN